MRTRRTCARGWRREHALGQSQAEGEPERTPLEQRAAAVRVTRLAAQDSTGQRVSIADADARGGFCKRLCTSAPTSPASSLRRASAAAFSPGPPADDSPPDRSRPASRATQRGSVRGAPGEPMTPTPARPASSTPPSNAEHTPLHPIRVPFPIQPAFFVTETLIVDCGSRLRPTLRFAILLVDRCCTILQISMRRYHLQAFFKRFFVFLQHVTLRSSPFHDSPKTRYNPPNSFDLAMVRYALRICGRNATVHCTP
jgi:hypothetical protein